MLTLHLYRREAAYWGQVLQSLPRGKFNRYIDPQGTCPLKLPPLQVSDPKGHDTHLLSPTVWPDWERVGMLLGHERVQLPTSYAV